MDVMLTSLALMFNSSIQSNIANNMITDLTDLEDELLAVKEIKPAKYIHLKLFKIVALITLIRIAV